MEGEERERKERWAGREKERVRRRRPGGDEEERREDGDSVGGIKGLGIR